MLVIHLAPSRRAHPEPHIRTGFERRASGAAPLRSPSIRRLPFEDRYVYLEV